MNLILPLTFLGLSLLHPAFSQTQSSSPPATLIWAGIEIATFRTDMAGHPPEARRDIARDTLRRLLADHQELDVHVETDDHRARFSVGGRWVFTLLKADLDLNTHLDEAAQLSAQRLREAIQADRQQGQPGYLLRGWLQIALALLLLTLFLSALAWSRGFLIRRSTRTAARRIEQLSKQGLPVVSTRHLLEFISAAITLAAALIAILATYLTVGFCLRVFPATRWFGNQMREIRNETLSDLGHAVLGALPGLLAVAIIFLAARFLSQTLILYFRRLEAGSVRNPWIDAEVAAPTRRLVVFIIWIIAVGMSYPYLPGSGTEAFKGLGVLLGLMISLGASSLVGQAASGLLLLYSRSLRIGEFVQAGSTEGTVVHLGVFTTRLRTVRREEISLPNSSILTGSITNFSRLAQQGGVALFTDLSIGYDTPWRQVHALLLQAAARTPDVLTDPPPFVHQTALDDFYIRYRLVIFVQAPERRGAILTNLHTNLLDAFNEAGVVITSPHYVADPPDPKLVPKTDWWKPPASPPS
ncbi:MAG: mechanosensitive ion channel domain-containing protein [Verrucomicrobiia bacterium]